jgi:DNA-binding protein HU-beta
MTKKELIEAIAKEAGLSIKDSEKALNAFVVQTEKALKKGRSVRIRGFGAFVLSKRKSRIVRHPRTGAKLNIPAKDVVKFIKYGSPEPH